MQTEQTSRYCSLAYDDIDVAWITLDSPDDGGNTIHLEVLRALHALLDRVAVAPRLRGLVLRTGRGSGFVTGLNTGELEALRDPVRAEAFAEAGQALTRRIATLPVPTVAAIRGTCSGPGLELALACDYRVIEAGTGVNLGLPEVRLGLHPCHGGTARLPAVVGAWRGLELLTSGRSVDGTEALRIGLADAQAESGRLDAVALHHARWAPRRRRLPLWDLPLRLWVGRWIVYRIIDTQKQRESSPENFPATYAILRLWRRSGGRPMDERIAAERESLVDLIARPSALNLVRTFLLQDRVKREARALDVPLPERIHVFGAGTIGSGLAAVLVLYGRSVVLHDPDAGALEVARRRARALLGQRMDRVEAIEEAIGRLEVTADESGVGDAEAVVESIPEDASAKRALYARVEPQLAPGVLIATTSATLPVEVLAEELADPQRLIGLHVFAPVERMPLVEVIAGQRSGERMVAQGQVLAAAMDKLPVRVRSGPGFLVNRLHLPYILKGAEMYDRSRRELIDTAAMRFGMPIGPLELADALGLDVCVSLAEQLGRTVPDKLRERVAAGHLGMRAGRGFHDWRNNRRVTASVPPGDHHYQEIAQALIAPLLEEARLCRDEGVAADGDLVDVAALFGCGFPAYTGGPLMLYQAWGWVLHHAAANSDGSGRTVLRRG